METSNYTEVVKNFDEILTRGLSYGVGTRNGQMCIEAAVCAAMGLPHGDNPRSGLAIVHAHSAIPQGDYYPLMGARMALEVLRELKSPGCDYL